MQANDDSSLQIYTALLQEKQAKVSAGTSRSPAEEALAGLRGRLEAIEDLMAVKVNLGDLTDKSVRRLENDIRTVIIAGIRGIPKSTKQKYIEASEAVEQNLYAAVDALTNALKELENKGKKTPRYITYLRTCQQKLEAALDMWKCDPIL